MHKHDKDIFWNPSEMNVKIIVGNCNRRSARHEMIRKRPKNALVQDRPINSEYIEIIKTHFSSIYEFLPVSFNRTTKKNKNKC
jgi:hypothetical protein